jgi:hypothetical protein
LAIAFANQTNSFMVSFLSPPKGEPRTTTLLLITQNNQTIKLIGLSRQRAAIMSRA